MTRSAQYSVINNKLNDSSKMISVHPNDLIIKFV